MGGNCKPGGGGGSRLSHMDFPPCPMTIRRQPAVHPVTIRAVQPGLRQPFVQPQESSLAAVARLKISPPTAVRLRHHRRPDPQVAPPPGLLISPHLSAGNHRLRLVVRHPGGALLPLPAHPGQGGGPSFLTPLADGRHADTENPGNDTRRTAFPVHRQGAFLVGGAGKSHRVWCSFRSRRGDRPGSLWRRRPWASSWSRIRGSGHRGDKRRGRAMLTPPGRG